MSGLKIKKEDFMKLHQLDRIEYRQRINLIEELYSLSPTSEITSFLLTIFGVSAIADILCSSYGYKGLFFSILPSVLGIFIAFILLIFLASLFNIYYKDKKIKELNEEYFNIKVKEKKK